MFCPHCGNQLPNGARFCSRCGNDVSGDSPTQRIPRPEMQPKYQQDAPEPPDSGRRTAKIILIAAIIAVIAVIVVAGSILIRNNVETQRAARDAQQALREAEEKGAMYGSAVPETEESGGDASDNSDDTEDEEEHVAASVPEEPDRDEIEEEEADDDPVAQDGEAPRHSEAYTNFRDRLDDLQDEYADAIPGGNTGEMVQNSSDLYKRCDDLLNEIYQHIKANMDSDSFAILREDEREWIKERDAKAEDDASDWVGGSGYGPIYTASLIESTLDRCEFLMGYVE